LGYADTEAEIMAEPTPALSQHFYSITHSERHLYRSAGRLVEGNRVVEEHHEAVACKALQSSL
jgi:hypothetical protein